MNSELQTISEPAVEISQPNFKERSKQRFDEFSDQFRKTVIANPMQMEVVRFKRRFLNVTGSSKLNRTLAGVVIFGYVFILALLFSVRDGIPPAGVAVLQIILMLLSAMVASHSAIAGEKDRRSWDLLQVAPITQHQIVVGKFKGAVTLLLTLQALFIPVFLLTFNGLQMLPDKLLALALVEGITLSVAMFASAATTYLSARMKNANITLVSAITGAVVIYAVIPLLAIAFFSSAAVETVLSLYHPFYYIIRVLEDVFDNYSNHSWIGNNLSATFMIIFAHFAAAGWLLRVTGNRLTTQRAKE